MSDLDERVAALIQAGRTGTGGGRFSSRVIDAMVARAVAHVLRVLRLEGRLTRDEVVLALAALVARYKTSAWESSRAIGVVDAQGATTGPTFLPSIPAGYRVPPAGFTQTAAPFKRPAEDDAPEDALDRLEKAFGTLEAEGALVEARVERLVDNEVSASAVEGYQSGGRLAGARGYRRRTNPDACELCFWLWKGGYVYPIDQPMHRHVGERCYPEYTTDRVGRDTGTAQENERRSEEEQRFMELYPTRTRS